MPEPSEQTPYEPMFTEPKREGGFPTAVVGLAAAAVAVVVLVLVLLGRHHGGDGTSAESASYSSNVQLSDIQMSESESLSGGKSTYIDGKLSNHGPQTVTGVTVKVAFPTDSGAAPQTMTVPVQVIRSREPYVDVVPVSAAPVAPGASADFRLIFEAVTEAWNQQQPNIQVTGVATR